MMRSSFERAAAGLARADGAAGFDLVLLDPPYERRPPRHRCGAAGKAADNLAALLAAAGEVIAPHAIVVLEHARRSPAPEAAGRLVRTRQVMAGDSALSFYAWRP
jgi:16S rRNA G966 N2-methylase RsmD